MQELLDPMQNPVTYAIPFFLLALVIEILSLRGGKHPDKTGYEFRDARASISMGVGSIVFLTLFKIASFFLFSAVYVWLAPWHLPTNTWWYWVAVIVGLDFFYYWNHRFVHRVNIGWAAHQSHHSSEYMNLGTALRQKWNPWSEAIFWLPLPLLGFAPWTLYVSFGANLVYQFWIHTELIGKLWRPIELVFNTPSHHRVHHGSDPEYLDKNYAGILIIWDRMFGSFTAETKRPTYGLTKPVNTYNVFTLEYGHYSQILAAVRAASTWRHKLGYLFGPPGWTPPPPPTIVNENVRG